MIGIKDFKMPKGCGDCACYDVEWSSCVFVNKSADDFDKRLEVCPLAEDVEPVVRCKDCEFRDGSACEYSAVWVHPNGYCHWGRKENE